MSEQKKPKIDLKARLGKKSVGSPQGAGGAIPPPVGIPKPPAMMPGVPGMPGSEPQRPRIDASDPYAAIEAQHAQRQVAEPKAIKVEMSEEVVQGQKKLMRRALIIGVGISVITGVIGFAFGDRSRSAAGAESALAGARMLVKEVDDANVVVGNLAEVLEAAAEQLGKGEYPADHVSKLGAINIPFEGSNLVGKGIGRFRPETVNLLISYTNGAQAANEQKERLQGILGGARQGIEALLEQKKTPKVRWGVYMMNGPHGPWGNMQLLPEPFLTKSDEKVKDADGKERAYDWPSEFKITDGKQEHTLKRYTSGDPMRSETPLMIPVAPQTETDVCPDSTIVRLRSELRDMQRILKGDDTPGREKTGLADLGEQVMANLRKIGTPD
jgi:hypothetical protein